MRLSVLGPLVLDGGSHTLSPRDRVVLAVLASRPGDPFRADVLADALWGEGVPASSAKVVQGCVMRLRRVLGPAAIETMGGGGTYRLALHHDEVDAAVFRRTVALAAELLADGRPDRARYHASRALALWRGDPLPELEDWPGASAGRAELVARHGEAEEVRAAAGIGLGLDAETIPELVRLTRDAPTRERRWELLALAEYRSGRQADALETLRRAQRTLVDDHGLDPAPALLVLQQAILVQDPCLELAPPAFEDGECPYPGLLSYGIGDSATFYGREQDVAACLALIDRNGLLAVVGPSGCGKSSLVRAGVAAALARDGRTPLVMTPGPQPATDLGALQLDDGRALVVDQLEELFAAPLDEQGRFVGTLLELLSCGHPVVLAIRADMVGELSAHVALARRIESGLHLVGPMSSEGLRRAVRGPAEEAGLSVEPGLEELLVREVEGQPAALPLLSHVLRETWAVREGRTLTVAGYRSTGGIQRAVSQTAEDLYRDLPSADQELLRRLMTRLVSKNEDATAVRHRVPVDALGQDDPQRLLVHRLVQARLLSTDGTSVEIAHEALTLAWPRLRSWLDEDVDGARSMRHLSVAAQTWEAMGRPDSELYRGARQLRAQEWRRRDDPALTEVEAAFLDAAEASATAERGAQAQRLRAQRRTNRRLKVGLASLVVLAVVAASAGLLASVASRRAEASATSADARLLGAEALRATEVDTGLLLGVAGWQLDDSSDTRANLLAALDRTPALLRTERVPRTTSIAVSESGGRLVSQAPERALELRSLDTLELVGEHPELRGPAVVASGDGSLVAASLMSELLGPDQPHGAIVLLAGDGSVAGAQLGGMPARRYVQQDLTLTPDGRWLAATFLDDTGRNPPLVGLWDMRRRESPVALLDLGPQSSDPTPSADGTTLYSVGEGMLRVTDVRTGQELRLLDGSDLGAGELGGSLALSADERRIAVAADRQVVLLAADTLSRLAVLPTPGDPGGVAFSASGSRLASAGESLVVWAVPSDGPPAEILDQPDSGSSPVFGEGGRTAYTAQFDGLLHAWDLTGTKGILRGSPAGIAVAGLARVSPDGRRILHVSLGADPAFVIVDAATGAVQRRVQVDQDATNLIDCAWSPDGSRVSVTTGDDAVGVWDSTTGERLATRALPVDEIAAFGAFTADGRLLVGTTAGRIHVLDDRTLEPEREPVDVSALVGGIGTVSSLVPRPGSSDVLTAVDGRGTWLVDVDRGTGRPLDIGHEVFGAAYSPDGARLAITTRQGEVGLYAVGASRWIAEPTARHPFAGWSAAFSRDGAEVAVAASGRLGRWDARTGNFLGAVTVGDDGVAGYGPGTGSLLLAGASGRTFSWALDEQAWVEAACRMAGRSLTAAEWRTYLPDREPEQVC